MARLGLRVRGPGSLKSKVQHPTPNLKSEGGAQRIECKKCYKTPANKGDSMINTGYTPGYHRAASGASPVQHGAGKACTGEVSRKNAE
jgi:hypothetical protein